MAKKVLTQIKLQAPGGQASPAPPVGPALGQHGVNIGQFVSQFNERTTDNPGMMLPVVLTVFSDRTFEFAVYHVHTGTTQHYRRTRGGVERVEAPPVAV